VNKPICIDEFHNNYFTCFPSELDPTQCSSCNKNFHYINRDGTVNVEQYDRGLLKSIQEFQRPRTEHYRRKTRK